MSRHGDIVLEWDGDEITFRLAIRHIRKLQEKCDAGPPELINRLAPAYEALRRGMKPSEMFALGLMGTWRADDIRETILQGLIGGGKSAAEAEKLVADRVDDRPLIDSLLVAFAILGAAVFGHGDEKVGEKMAKRKGPKKSRSRAAKSASPKSTETGRP